MNSARQSSYRPTDSTFRVAPVHVTIGIGIYKNAGIAVAIQSTPADEIFKTPEGIPYVAIYNYTLHSILSCVYRTIIGRLLHERIYPGGLDVFRSTQNNPSTSHYSRLNLNDLDRITTIVESVLTGMSFGAISTNHTDQVRAASLISTHAEYVALNSLAAEHYTVSRDGVRRESLTGVCTHN